MTARHFGYSPDTISRWVRAYHSGGVSGLEPKNRRPRRVRQPQTSVEVEDIPTDLGGLEQALLAWNRAYETVRPHQALDY